MKKTNRCKYNNDYNKDRYDRIGICIPKGDKKRWTKFAKELGLSLTAFIIKAVENY